MAAEVVIQRVINPSVSEDRRIRLPHMENAPAAIVGYRLGLASRAA